MGRIQRSAQGPVAEIACAPRLRAETHFRSRKEAVEKALVNQRSMTKRLVAATLCGIPATLLANGMRLASQDAFACARGEAFVATADNPSAIYYNAAGITQLEGDQVQFGIYGIYLDPTFVPPDGAGNSGRTYRIGHNLAAVPQFFYTHRLRNERLSFGLGIYSPHGADVSWPQDTGFRAVATDAALKYIRFSPVVALKLLPGLSVGAGAMVDYGNIELEQGLLRTASPFANFFRFKADGWSAGYTAGLRYQPHEKVSLGASFRSRTTITMSGKTEFEQQPVIQPTSLPARADFEFPLTAAFGISYRPTAAWNLEFNADYTDWSSLRTVTIHQEERPPYPIQQDISMKLQWQLSWLFAFGVTRYFEHNWHASAGYVFNENSVPNAYYTPLAADLDRHFLSIGVGHKGRRFDFDVAYQFGYGPAHTVTGSAPSSQPGFFAGQTANGSYAFISHAVLVTAGLRF